MFCWGYRGDNHRELLPSRADQESGPYQLPAEANTLRGVRSAPFCSFPLCSCGTLAWLPTCAWSSATHTCDFPIPSMWLAQRRRLLGEAAGGGAHGALRAAAQRAGEGKAAGAAEAAAQRRETRGSEGIHLLSSTVCAAGFLQHWQA
jgi:hypothetical protein